MRSVHSGGLHVVAAVARALKLLGSRSREGARAPQPSSNHSVLFNCSSTLYFPLLEKKNHLKQ